MKNSPKLKVFLVDDDALYLKDEEIDMNQKNEYNIKTFATGELCIAHLSQNPDVIVIDYWLNGVTKDAMNGQQVLDEVKRFNSDIAVVILSEQKKIDVAVNCMHHRAFDYVEKGKTAFSKLHHILHTIRLMNL